MNAQLQTDLVFEGYRQDAWVELQRYQEAFWPDLVGLWHLHNRQIAHVIGAVPQDVREAPRCTHNLDELAWRPVPKSQPATLGYFMDDYVAHLCHHLRQIFASLGAASQPGDPWQEE